MMNKLGQNAGPIVIAVFIVVMVSGLIIGFVGFDSVDASHRGVKVRLGKITGTMEPGMEWTGPLTKVYQYDLRVRKMTVDMAGNQGAVDRDGQSVFATIEVNYKINPSNVERAYAEIGQDHYLADVLRLEGIIKEGFKTITSQYSSLEIFQKRQEVKDKAIEQIQSRFPQEYFNIENVIISNIDFNPAFKSAIEQGKVAEEMAKAKEKEVEVEKFEADKKIEMARGVAESEKLQAEAKAYRILQEAKSEAESLRLKRQELTPLMVQNNWIDAWASGANVPMYIAGDGGNAFIMSMPNTASAGDINGSS